MTNYNISTNIQYKLRTITTTTTTTATNTPNSPPTTTTYNNNKNNNNSNRASKSVIMKSEYVCLQTLRFQETEM
jgi:hypothetical protein